MRYPDKTRPEEEGTPDLLEAVVEELKEEDLEDLMDDE